MTLNLHSGGELVTYDQLRAVPVPAATDTHLPLPHHELVEMVRFTLNYHGHEIIEEHHAIDHEGMRYFGLMTLRSSYGDYADTLGLRNSNDRSFPIGVAFGSKVFVCSNLSFMGTHVIKRKHTARAKRELPALLGDIIAPLQAERIAQNQKLLTYQQTPLTDMAADHAILDMYRRDIIGVQRIGDVVREWETPSHDYGAKTAWRLLNAATFALSGKVAERPDLTRDLHQVIDGVCHRVH
ncbi:DUF932 domain-containing protein [Bradyrhizobium diazoefficiens]|uniref:DUF932 domain-containing protein n=1 Tax=Bradyrhizobium diazoefficiens TaxID=1355477 RepID=UPI001909FF35|nr:DUF932 domain-containing protein [Bradyrhizobium diazoefficiens]MBK3666188.1 DUF932 domain-containing protein [Bradyrhizobium diazoefficiens]